ncbi:MAG: glycoside hydrolase family 15 protein, partial [Acidimicrobiales bacterium]
MNLEQDLEGAQLPLHVLREYALVADGERGILIGPRGEMAWMCAPHWDSDAIFSTLIGGAGTYAITPRDNRFVWGGFYEPGSLIWRSRWITTNSVIECREALKFPGDPSCAVILRRVVAVEGDGAVHVVLDPRAEFGLQPMTDLHLRDGVWSARCGALYLRWTGAESATLANETSFILDLNLQAGTHHDFVLELSDHVLTDAPHSANADWRATESAWSAAVPHFDETLAPRDAQQAYAVLRGLTSAGGGMVAAATMSLPERANAGRNYDYRYAWIRDQCYAGQAVAVNQADPLLDDAVSFITARLIVDGPTLKPAYRIDGSGVPSERSLPHLKGYPGGSDKLGNWVNGQFQLDAFGETLLLFAAAGRHDHLDAENWRAVKIAVSAIAARWQEPDAGIWEIDNDHWTHSRLICVAGLRAVATTATSSERNEWNRLAETILADATANGVHRSGRWQRSPKDKRIDASLLLSSIRGAVPSD